MSNKQSEYALDIKKWGTTTDGKQLVAWDSITDCTGDDCPASGKCHLKNHNSKCKVQINYNAALLDATLKMYGHGDELTLFKIGMHLVPLYNQLCRLKIIEMGVPNMLVINDKGNQIIHPVYKEIQSIIRCISIAWKDLELVPVMPPRDPDTDEEPDRPRQGRQGYTESISENRSRRGIIR